MDTGRFGRTVGLIAALIMILSIGPLSGPAIAWDTPDGSTEFQGETTDEGFAPAGDTWVDENGVTQSLLDSPDAIQFCDGSQPGGIDYPAQVYKYFTDGGPLSPQIPIYLDEYRPTAVGVYPALVLVHGGGWALRCRWSENGVALTLVGDNIHVVLDQNFIVFAIDYRLACDASDPNITGTPLEPLCGWPYPRLDAATGDPGAAIQDVMDGVAWVRSVWGPDHGDIWNGTIGVLGGSAGGNIATVASALATGDASPDAVVAISASWEFDSMPSLPNSDYGCNWPWSNDEQNCWIGSLFPGSDVREGGVNRYLDCEEIVGESETCEDAPVGNGMYAAASPLTYFLTNTDQPPQYLINGGFCPQNLCPELVASQELVDFGGQLAAIGFPPDDRKQCRVHSSIHAFALLSRPCEGSTRNAWYDMDDWLATHLS